MATFGELLAELRHDRGMRQEDLARVLFVSPSTISNYEQNVQLPPLERIKEIADFFDVTIDYLLGRCTVSISPDLLERPLLPDRTAGEVIRDILRLDQARKNAIALILEDMTTLHNIIGEVR